MRILLLAQFYPPIMGGVERHVQSLGAGLAARGHDVSVATLWHKGLPEFEMDGPVRIHRIRGTMQRLTTLFTVDRQHSPPFPDPEAAIALRRVIVAEKPEIVHAHNWLMHSFLPIKHLGKAKLVLTLHDCELACVQMRMMYMDKTLCAGPGLRCLGCAAHHYGPLKGAVTLAGNRLMAGIEHRLVDMFVPVSNAIADANQLTGSGLPYCVIPNFVPDKVDEIDPELDERVAALPEGYILQVGDLALDKGIEVLLAAYRELDSAPPLVLIGRRLPESPQNLPANVTLINGLPHKAVMQAWQHSLFGTVPSTCLDASPTVTLEAMACGKAVIGSNIGGIPDQIVEGETGFLVPPGDAGALRVAMTRLITDESLRVRMGAAARLRVDQFRASSVVGQIEEMYISLKETEKR